MYILCVHFIAVLNYVAVIKGFSKKNFGAEDFSRTCYEQQNT